MITGKLVSNPIALLLTDGIGALVTPLLMLLILNVVNPYFGMPKGVL